MQAIVTKYIGPTNARGSRVKATCAARSITLEWNCAFNAEENHTEAARALCVKLGWVGKYYTDLVCGQLPSGEYAHVFAPKIAAILGAK